VTGSGVAIALRDYQHECLDTILTRYRAGVRRQLICLPTGTGKTVVFAQFPGYFRMKKRMLVLAHREELLDQARDKIARSNPELSVEVEQAGRRAGTESQVVVASIATLGRKGSARLARLDPEQFYLLVVDEAHHATAATYRRVLDHFGVFDPDTPKLLVGFTATPKRGDGQGLDEVFQEISFSRTLPEMIDTGYLAPVAGLRLETDVDLTGVRTRMGDFVPGQLSRKVNVRERNELVVKVYQEHLAERQTICFCVGVDHAHSLAACFRAHDVAAAAVTGKMASEERRSVLEAFGAGRLQVLTNCMVLTEGYDEPSVAGIILARPTRSSLLYIQMIGRGTRLFPDKENVIIIDVVDVTRSHCLVTLPSLFGLSDDFDMEGRTTGEIDQALRWTESNRPWVRTDLATSLSDLRYRCRHVNLFDLELPDELWDCASMAWVGIGSQGYRLSLGDGERVMVSPTIIGAWEVTLSGPKGRLALGKSEEVDHAIQLAEQWLRRYRRRSLPLVSLEAAWRNKPASAKQLTLLRKRGIEVPREVTRGEASHLIAMLPPTRPPG
jgi:superfamily II DNA or RNA helicase